MARGDTTVSQGKYGTAAEPTTTVTPAALPLSNVLVTGATGVVGRQLISALLDTGHEVTASERERRPHLRRHAGVREPGEGCSGAPAHDPTAIALQCLLFETLVVGQPLLVRAVVGHVAAVSTAALRLGPE